MIRPTFTSLRTPPRLAAAALLLLGFFSVALHAAPQEVPYDVEQFRALLDRAKLQYPKSSPAAITYGDFAGQEVPGHFYLSDQNMVFSVDGAKNRCELRFKETFQTQEETSSGLAATVKIHLPQASNKLQRYTFMQVHHQAKGAKPMIRLYWSRDAKYKQPASGLWAALRDEPGGKVEHYYLGQCDADRFMPIEIKVQNNVVEVFFDHESKLNQSVAGWQDKKMYFKAGVYNQTEGTSKSEFSSLRVYFAGDPEPQPVDEDQQPVTEPM